MFVCWDFRGVSLAKSLVSSASIVCSRMGELYIKRELTDIRTYHIDVCQLFLGSIRMTMLRGRVNRAINAQHTRLLYPVF